MTTTAAASDRVRASVLVRVPQAEAFALFTEHIDAWWRRGLRFRHAGARAGLIHLEPRVGGRLFESFDIERGESSGVSGPSGPNERVVEVGRVLEWTPPRRLVFSWRSANFTPTQSTSVEVTFDVVHAGTMVTVVHSGWAGIPADHPVRHGQAVAAFLRTMGLWWGEQLGSLRLLARSATSGMPPPA